MFKSKDVAYWKPSSFSSKSWIFGIGKGFLFILLFSSRKSEMNWIIPFFFGMMNVGAAHSERFTFRKTPMLHKRSTSVRKVCSWIFGIGYAWAWYGFTPGWSSISYSSWFQNPKVPSNKDSYLVSTLRSDSRSSTFRCWHSAVIFSRSAFSYVASRIRFIRSVLSCTDPTSSTWNAVSKVALYP